MKAITFILTLEEPFLATQVNNGEPNSAISYPFVPGSMIRGALVGKYLQGKGENFDLAADSDARALFLDGSVRYLNAYLYDAGRKQRLLPRPKSWFVEKAEAKAKAKEVTIFDFAALSENERGTALGTPKSLSGDFVEMVGDQPLLVNPDYHVTVHNTTDEPGKKKEGVSQMYRYEALAAGQQFQGVILVEDDAYLADLKAWLSNATLTLGGSSSGGYGLATVSRVKEVNSWTEYQSEAVPDNYHILTCLSDILVRNDGGQVVAAMAAALGIDQKSVEAFQDVHVAGGFNQKWGLPLPQAWVITAGSVFRIKKDAIDVGDLEKFIAAGIGERTAEGFGRVALNWHTRPEWQRLNEGLKAAGNATDELSGYGRAVAQQMANRRLRQQLETALADLIHQQDSFTGLPSATQLSRVRLAARHALAQNNLQVIASHLDSLKGARSQWQGARTNTKDLFAWIRTVSRLDPKKEKDRAEFRKLFGLRQLPSIADVSAELTEGLMVEFTARLIDGVMKLAVEKAKKDKEQPQREGVR